VDKDGNPTLLLSDGGGKPKMVGTVDKDGTTTLSLVDGKLNPRIALTVSPNGEPKITIRNADNEVTWEAP
ncbi:MAG: hypothetical protein HY329_21425, partial [Chloroflexi bacterium]|nr:hypothetical protein [Chloroflexota bacterium]